MPLVMFVAEFKDGQNHRRYKQTAKARLKYHTHGRWWSRGKKFLTLAIKHRVCKLGLYPAIHMFRRAAVLSISVYSQWSGLISILWTGEGTFSLNTYFFPYNLLTATC